MAGETELWPEIKSLLRIESAREIAGIRQHQTRYYISSLKESVDVFNRLIRSHWTIENTLHWTLDMVFKEDECKKRKGYSAENFTLVPKIAFNLLKRDKRRITGVGKLHLASWDNQYLISLIKN